ncbi:MAG: hypothetical protein ABI787_02965 [Spartobacteria bacterium]
MSLKGFHIVFITFSTLLAFGIGIWCLWINSMGTTTTGYLTGAICSFAAAVALIVYGCWFWRKMKRLRLI